MIWRWGAFSSCLLAIRHTCSMFCHIVRTCGVRHLVNGPSLISNRRNSLNNRFHVLQPVEVGRRLFVASGQRITLLYCHVYTILLPQRARSSTRISCVLCATTPNPFSHTGPLSVFRLARITGRKYLLQLTINPVCVLFQTIPQNEGIQSPSAGRF